MILFREDWDKYPYAVVHEETKNKTFKAFSYKMLKNGVRNHNFPLVLMNKGLAKVDPHSNNLSRETISEIVEECGINPFYSFREIIRAPAGELEPFRANRANMAFLWSFFNHVTFVAIQPRQTGKSFTAHSLTVVLANFLTRRTDISWLLKDTDLRVGTLVKIKQIEKAMPHYLQFRKPSDADNTHVLEVSALENLIKCYIGNDNPANAERVARGITSAIFFGDEIAFVRNLKIVLPIILSSGGDARDKAARYNKPYGTVLMTTAGNPDDRDGGVAHRVALRSAEWYDSYYDCENQEELHKVITSVRGTLRINGTFNHRQLGYTDEWLRRKIKERELDPEDDREGIERDYLNIWPAGTLSSPLNPNQTRLLKEAPVEPEYIEIDDNNGLSVRWYIEEMLIESYVNGRPHVLSMDSSDASGDDDIGIVLRDVRTGGTTAAAEFNVVNVIVFCEWLSKWFIRFPNIVMIPERRYNGSTMIDYFILALEAAGEDPFKRIFNRVVHEPENYPALFEEIQKPVMHRQRGLTERNKKVFGFTTSGSGYASRSNLYGTVLKQCVNKTGRVVKDKKIVSQLLALRKVNNRVDHDANGNDDLVIAWLLSFWFLVYAENTDFYGLEPTSVLRDLDLENNREAAVKKETTARNLNRIQQLSMRLKTVKDARLIRAYEDQLRKLYDELPQDSRDNNTNVADYIQSIKQRRDRMRFRNR